MDHAIEEMRARADFLEQALDAAGLGWWRSDLGRGGGLTWSAATYRIFGVTPAEFDGRMKTFLHLFCPEDTGKVSAAIAAACQDRAFCRMEHRIVRPDGSVRWVEQSLVVAGDQDGAATRMLGICQDVTNRKRIEDENRAAAGYNRSLTDASLDPLVTIGPDETITDVSAATGPQQRFHAIFETAPAGICDMTPSGEFIAVNPRFCQLTGYTADELRSLRMQDILHPDDLAADLAGTERLLSGEIDAYAAEKRFLRRAGGVVWAEVNRSVIRDQAGTTVLLIGVTRDITAQRQAEAEVASLTRELQARVEQRTAELEQANGNLEAFTYSVTHDLCAPLRAVSGFAGALAEEYGACLPDTGREYVRRIGAAGERMATLIDDLLDLSRVSRAEVGLHPVDLSAEVAAIAAELRSHEPDRKVRIGIAGGVVVTADRNLIRTVLQNLLGNAWKFTARCADASIEFGTVTAADAAVCCFVRDNGAGFDPAYAGKLFRPFQRLHPVAEFAGTGIGLASVRQIIERHGGRTWAEGTVGGGATFYFTLNARAATRPREGRAAGGP